MNLFCHLQNSTITKEGLLRSYYLFIFRERHSPYKILAKGTNWNHHWKALVENGEFTPSKVLYFKYIYIYIYIICL